MKNKQYIQSHDLDITKDPYVILDWIIRCTDLMGIPERLIGIIPTKNESKDDLPPVGVNIALDNIETVDFETGIFRTSDGRQFVVNGPGTRIEYTHYDDIQNLGEDVYIPYE